MVASITGIWPGVDARPGLPARVALYSGEQIRQMRCVTRGASR